MPRAQIAPFVGRVVERRRLLDLWDATLAGRPVVALISGDAGAGKTRLLDEVATRARTDGTVVIGSCVQVAGMGVPYLPIVDALRSIESTELGREVLRQEAARRPVLARLIPHLGEPASVDADEENAAAQQDSSTQFRGSPPGNAPTGAASVGEAVAQGQLFEALHRVLTRLAEQTPVLLLLEDLHWADRSTRDLISFLARTLRNGRIALMATYRTDDLHRRHPLRSLLAELTRLPYVERVALEPFSRAELAELLEAMSQTPLDPAVLDRIFQRSEGNAFFAEELMRSAQVVENPATQQPRAAPRTNVIRGTAMLPDDLADVLLARVRQLPEHSRDVLKVAAVGGRRAASDLLISASAADPDATEEGLREAVEAGLLVTDGETYAFRHALVQEAIYGDLLPGERVRLHTTFAALLTRPAELAHHRLAAHDLPGALEALVAAATEAESLAAPAEALRHLDQAVELLQHLGTGADLLNLLSRAAEAAAASGDPNRGVTLGRAAVAEADRRGDAQTRAATRERLALYLMESDELPITVADEAAALVADAPPSQLVARVLAVQARAWYWSDSAKAGRLLTAAIEMADRTGATDIAVDAMVTQALLVRRGFMPGDSSQVLMAATAREGDGEDWARVRIRALRFRSGQLMEDGDLVAALATADEGVAFAAETGLSWTAFGMDLRLMRGWVLIAAGRWDEALTASLQAVYAPTPAGRLLATQAVGILVGRGAPEAEALLARLRGTGDNSFEVQLDLAESDLRRAQGRPVEALAAAAHGLGLFDPVGWSTETLLLAVRVAAAHADLAVAARVRGDESDASVHAEAARVAADRTARIRDLPTLHGPFGAMWVARLNAEVSRAAGTDTGEDWAAVSNLAERIGHVPVRAAARAAEAQTRLNAGDRGVHTVQALAAALADARSLGAVSMATELESLIHRARLDSEVRAVSVHGSAWSSSGADLDHRDSRHDSSDSRGVQLSRPPTTAILTGRETEVLHLVAAGKSNRQIGQELFISGKTASVHVSHIMEKLGAASRTEAAALARQRGLLSSR